MFDDIANRIGEGSAVPVQELKLRIGGIVPPPFDRDSEVIASKWRERQQANPHLFNGMVFLQSNLRLEDGRLAGTAVQLDYASFLHWRGNQLFQAQTDLYHVFPLAALESSDGDLIAVRSASTTINSGLTYFAAGMFDGDDVSGHWLDPSGNMRREVAEETGLDIQMMQTDNALVALRTGRFVAVFQKFVSDMNTNLLVSSIKRHAAMQDVPEIDDAIVIKNADDISGNMPGYMQAYCRWRFRPE
jgi:8-oxo-dGTP pyrophosphatase MutT (NUDIX family)